MDGLQAVSDSLATGVATVQGQTAGATSISNALNTLLQTVTQSEGAESGTALAAATVASVTNALANIDAYANASTINGVNLLGAAGSLNVLSNLSGAATTVTHPRPPQPPPAWASGGTNLTALVTGSVANTTTAIALINTAIGTINSTLTDLGSAAVQLQGLASFTSQLSTSTTTSIGRPPSPTPTCPPKALSCPRCKPSKSLAIQSLSIANQGPELLAATVPLSLDVPTRPSGFRGRPLAAPEMHLGASAMLRARPGCTRQDRGCRENGSSYSFRRRSKRSFNVGVL